MKTLFIFWSERLNEQRGGIHRVILLLLKHLPLRGFDVHYLYTLDNYKSFYVFNQEKDKETTLSVSNLKQYLIDNHCDIILGQDGVFSSKLTEIVEEMNLKDVVFVNEYHNTPILLLLKLSKDYLKFEFKLSKNIKYKLSLILKYLFFPLWHKRIKAELAKNYRYNYDHSDVSLLLTEREVPVLEDLLNEKHLDKCYAIPNPLSWEEIADESILNEKKKEVLVVSRIYNPEKRIDLMLKVWKELQKRNAVDDWMLRIVGDGIHREYLMQMANEMGIKNIIWEGWSDPKPFYRTASIFFMTSACEGWGLTLTESMQTGTVPLAFDTYPALRNIINDGYDGYIVQANNVKLYADRVEQLMMNHELCETIAKNALQSCRRFSTEKIMDKWAEFLKTLKK